MSGTLTSKTDVTLEDIKLNLSTTMTGASSIAKRLTLTIGNSTFTHSTLASGTYQADFAGTVVIPAGQTLNVKLVAETVENTAPANATLTVSNLVPSSFATVEYVASGDPVTSFL